MCAPDPGPMWRHVAWWLAVIALAVVGVVAMVSAVTAQPVQCVPTDAMHRALGSLEYQRIGYGQRELTFNGTRQWVVSELWIKPDGTLMSIFTTAQGRSCFTYSGEGWVALEAEPPGEDG